MLNSSYFCFWRSGFELSYFKTFLQIERLLLVVLKLLLEARILISLVRDDEKIGIHTYFFSFFSFCANYKIFIVPCIKSTSCNWFRCICSKPEISPTSKLISLTIKQAHIQETRKAVVIFFSLSLSSSLSLFIFPALFALYLFFILDPEDFVDLLGHDIFTISVFFYYYYYLFFQSGMILFFFKVFFFVWGFLFHLRESMCVFLLCCICSFFFLMLYILFWWSWRRAGLHCIWVHIMDLWMLSIDCWSAKNSMSML